RRPARAREQEPDACLTAMQTPPPRLRIGVTTRSPSGSAVHRDCVRAVRAAAAELVLQGHCVEEAEPAALSEYLDRALHGALIGAAEYRGCLDDLAVRLGRAGAPGDVAPFPWGLAHLDAGTTTRRRVAPSRDRC